MKLFAGRLAAIACLLPAAASGGEYPRLELSPESPTTADSVTLRLTIGLAPRSCVPGFEATFTVAPVFPTGYPPEYYPPGYKLKLQYTGSPPLRSGSCSDSLVEYGPEWHFGPLGFGGYVVRFEKGMYAMPLEIAKSNLKPIGTYSSTSANACGRFDVLHAGQELWLGGSVTRYDSTRFEAIRPLTGATVRLFAPDTSGDSVSYRCIDTSVVTTFYEVHAPRPGAYRLVCAAEGYRERTVPVVLPHDGMLEVRLICDTAEAVLTVAATWSNGRWWVSNEPAPGCSVSVVCLDSTGDTLAGTAVCGRTDSAGICTLAPIPVTVFNQTAHIRAWSGSLASCTASVALGGGPTFVRVELPSRRAHVPDGATVVIRDSLYHILSSATLYSSSSDAPRLVLQYEVRNPTAETLRVSLDRICWLPGRLSIDLSGSLRFLAVAPEGDTLCSDENGGTNPNCAPLSWQTALAPGESFTMTSSLCTGRSASDTATVYAWLSGQEPDTALHLGVRWPATAIRLVSPARDGSGAAPSARSVSGDRLRLVMPADGTVSLSVLSLDGRLVCRPVRHRSYGAGAVDVQLPSGARGLRVVRIDVGGRRSIVLSASGM